ncbi:MAG: BlaI/MecI/CopY family transcriptional regulator [Tepidisphaeraceae bacterium]
MAKRANLARSELEVAQVVWRLGEARVRDVVEALPPDPKPDFWTVQTHLRRLKAKGYLRTRTEGRAHVYRPAVNPARVIREVVQDFVNRAFGGASLPLVQHLIEDNGLSDDDLDKLQDTLEQLKRRRKS